MGLRTWILNPTLYPYLMLNWLQVHNITINLYNGEWLKVLIDSCLCYSICPLFSWGVIDIRSVIVVVVIQHYIRASCTLVKSCSLKKTLKIDLTYFSLCTVMYAYLQSKHQQFFLLLVPQFLIGLTSKDNSFS